MRRLVALLLVSVFLAAPALAREARPRDPEPRIIKVVKKIIKKFVPSTNGDYLVPPKP